MKNTKVIAFYLPQFHEIEENNIWWGQGFTDWTNVKKSAPLYREHYQPRIPLNDNYYDLLDVETLKWQTSLASEYGIYGFAIYHYWFNGKKLLERPVELLLQHQEIDFPYCLCWANEKWTRTWDAQGNKEILIDQEYGETKAWIQHFDYLYNFFIDERYIKIDGQPVLIIYRTNSIECLSEMIACWNEECEKRGLKRLYIISENNSYQSDYDDKVSSAVLDFEPMYTIQYDRTIFDKIIQRICYKMKNIHRRTNIHFYDYDWLWERIIDRKKIEKNKKMYLGAFVDWDNTARKGKNGVVIEGANPDKFYSYFLKLIEKSEDMCSEFLFINAWNEWAEGTYLEPDKKNHYAYLEQISKVINN